MQPVRMTILMAGRRYAVDTAKLLASGELSSGQGEPVRTTFLFRTEDGLYFIQHRAEAVGGDPHDERIWMEPVAAIDAAPLFAELKHKQMTFEEAFSD